MIVYPKSDETKMIAQGNFHSVNPDRIVLKKVILTGYPIRVRKKMGVVKHMFHNPEVSDCRNVWTD